MMHSELKLYNGRLVKYSHPERLHLPRYIAAHGLKNYEPVSQGFFIAAAEIRKGCIYDIGSNIGVYSLAVASILRVPVYAFEPYAEAASVLKGIAADYDLPVYVKNCAVSDFKGKIEFYISKKSDMSNSLNPNFRSHREVRTVEVLTVDSLSEITCPGAIKIDVETEELKVLQGARITIQRDRPIILMEVLTAELEVSISNFMSEYHYITLKMGDPDIHAELGNVADLDTSGDSRNWLMLPIEVSDNPYLMNRARHYIEIIRNN